MILKALHGFLGRPSDWTELFHSYQLNDFLQAEDLLEGEIIEMGKWAKAFNAKHVNGNKNMLLGYSLGGRLALHALIDNPLMWTSAVIISANLGLHFQEDKTHRQIVDERWAERFENESWDTLMHEWNCQDVFKHDSYRFERNEAEYSRHKLSIMLRHWSLSKQSNLQAQMAELPMPILWVVGSEDSFYVQQAAQLQFSHPLSEIWVVPKAGHRVPWQYPKQFLLKITQFFDKVSV